MIDYYVVDFREHRSAEDVISFFWRSVYIKIGCTFPIEESSFLAWKF